MFRCTLLYVPSSFAIILMGKRELVALLSLSSWCLVNVVWLFLAVSWVCLQFMIVVFSDQTHYFWDKPLDWPLALTDNSACMYLCDIRGSGWGPIKKVRPL